jgi:hypothetical protein
MSAIDKLIKINIYLVIGGFNTYYMRVLNNLVNTIDNLAQQMHKHFDDRHITDRLHFYIKGK